MKKALFIIGVGKVGKPLKFAIVEDSPE